MLIGSLVVTGLFAIGAWLLAAVGILVLQRAIMISAALFSGDSDDLLHENGIWDAEKGSGSKVS